MRIPPHLLSTNDLTTNQLKSLLNHSVRLKSAFKSNMIPPNTLSGKISQSLDSKTVAVLFNKRSTRTRVAAETSIKALGGHPLFLSPSDIQLGVNESLRDTSQVISSMTDGIFARVGEHEDIETLAKYSNKPVLNALSDLYHPTQILADLLTISEEFKLNYDGDSPLSGLNVGWVGDGNNIINDLLLSLPRLGANVQVATPKGYEIDKRALTLLESQGKEVMNKVKFTNVPEEAVNKVNVILTDTWISMGQEEEKKKRLKDFEGFQVSEQLAKRGGANDNWKFMHCLPRKQEEVNDDVFYGERSIVFNEAENRKWTILSLFDKLIGNYTKE